MRRALIVVVILVAAFAVVFVVRRGSTLPVSAVLAYEFKAGTTATYDISMVVTNTVGSGATSSRSLTTVDMASHVNVQSTDSAGVATVQVSLDQPTVKVDGTLIASPLRVTTARLRIRPNGQVDSVTFPGAGRTVSILSEQGRNGIIKMGTTLAQGGTDPLQSVLLLAQGSLPAMPSGQIKVGQQWRRASVINAPYMLLEAALANSQLVGFSHENELTVAHISTQATTPIDLQTYQAQGSPLHVTGSQTFAMQSYFAPDLHVLLRSTGTGHVDITQAVNAGSTTSHTGNLTVTTPPVHSTTDISFTAKLRQ